jgi:hypothetical protein
MWPLLTTVRRELSYKFESNNINMSCPRTLLGHKHIDGFMQC